MGQCDINWVDNGHGECQARKKNAGTMCHDSFSAIFHCRDRAATRHKSDVRERRHVFFFLFFFPQNNFLPDMLSRIPIQWKNIMAQVGFLVCILNVNHLKDWMKL